MHKDDSMAQKSCRDKKIDEQYCLSAVLNSVEFLSNYCIAEQTESPDFVITNGTKRIGVEHFLVDTNYIIRVKKSCSGEVQFESESRQYGKSVANIVDSYKKHNDDSQALKEVQELINCSFKLQDSFSCLEFLYYFFEMVLSHAQKIARYKSHCSLDSVGFICEIPISDCRYLWDVTVNKQTYLQKIESIPMTKLMWWLISKLLERKEIEFFAIVTVPALTSDERRNNLTRVVCYTCDDNPSLLYDCFHYHGRGVCADLHFDDEL